MIEINKPTKSEQKAAMESYAVLASAIHHLRSELPEIEIEETNEKLRIPISVLKLLADILKEISEGKPVSIVPFATEMTTQAAAELLGCSRPHLVKLLEKGDIAYTKVGKHRRVKYEDVVNYRKKLKAEQKRSIIEIMGMDEESGLYDS